MNVVALTGRLTREPELTYTSVGKAVAKFGLAVDRQFKRDGGQECDFFDVVTFGKSAEFAAQYLDKGALVGVAGRVEIDRVEKDGQRRQYVNVIAESVQSLERRADAEARRAAPAAPPADNWAAKDDDDPFADQ